MGSKSAEEVTWKRGVVGSKDGRYLAAYSPGVGDRQQWMVLRRQAYELHPPVYAYLSRTTPLVRKSDKAPSLSAIDSPSHQLNYSQLTLLLH